MDKEMEGSSNSNTKVFESVSVPRRRRGLSRRRVEGSRATTVRPIIPLNPAASNPASPVQRSSQTLALSDSDDSESFSHPQEEEQSDDEDDGQWSQSSSSSSDSSTSSLESIRSGHQKKPALRTFDSILNDPTTRRNTRKFFKDDSEMEQSDESSQDEEELDEKDTTAYQQHAEDGDDDESVGIHLGKDDSEIEDEQSENAPVETLSGEKDSDSDEDLNLNLDMENKKGNWSARKSGNLLEEEDDDWSIGVRDPSQGEKLVASRLFASAKKRPLKDQNDSEGDELEHAFRNTASVKKLTGTRNALPRDASIEDDEKEEEESEPHRKRRRGERGSHVTALDVVQSIVDEVAEEMVQELEERGRGSYSKHIKAYSAEVREEFDMYNNLSKRFVDKYKESRDLAKRIQAKRSELAAIHMEKLRMEKLISKREAEFESIQEYMHLQSKANAYLASLSSQ